MSENFLIHIHSILIHIAHRIACEHKPRLTDSTASRCASLSGAMGLFSHCPRRCCALCDSKDSRSTAMVMEPYEMIARKEQMVSVPNDHSAESGLLLQFKETRHQSSVQMLSLCHTL
jgi:hypothetical protein